ncbi:MAG: caspase family protein [Treponema sp.]
MTLLKKILCLFLLLSGTAAVFAQEAKHALLIANSDYPNEIGGNLSQPVSEAKALKTALESIGFEVMLTINADRETMDTALQQFKQKTLDARGIAFFHYGGHAVQVQGINYLIPAHTNIEDESKVRYRCIELDEIMDSMGGTKNIAVLDSCRNNPFGKSRGGSGTRGLAAVNKRPRNSSIIIYAAGTGQTAQDGVFTPILTKKITKKDKTIEDILKEVTKEVEDKTGDMQKPAAYTQLKEDIFLAGRTSSVTTLTGSLLINSEYAGTVSIDGEKKGTINEDGTLLLENLRTGSYTVVVTSEINAFKKKVKINADTQTVVNIKTGSIILTSEVSGSVYLNGRYYGTVSRSEPAILTKLGEGTYHIEIRTDSATFKKEATVRVGEIATVAMYKPEEPVKKVQPEVKTQPAAKKDSMYEAEELLKKAQTEVKTQPAAKKEPVYENVYKAEEPIVKSVSQKTESYSDDSFYALGFYGSYNLGISPVYKEPGGSTNETQKPFLNQGFSVGFIWARICVYNFLDCQFFTGYTFYHHSFGNNESITHHEFDAVGLKLGMGSNRIKFHFIPIQLYSHWEEVRYTSIRGKENMTGTARFGIAAGCDLEFVISNYFSMYAEYRSRITLASHVSFKHSCNFGINLNVLKVRI